MPCPLPPLLLGLDFSCAPSPRKPLTLARGRRVGGVLVLDGVDEWPSLDALDSLLADGNAATADGFVLACDFPFGLPRPFVDALSAHGPAPLAKALNGALHEPGTAPTDALIQSLRQHVSDRAGFQRLVDDWGVGWQPERQSDSASTSKLIHRRTDAVTPTLRSTSPLQTRYVPVGKMYFEGLSRLVHANLTLPGQRQGRPRHIALEAWPGLVAAQVIGRQRSYKSDKAAHADVGATPERLIARMDLIDALEQGRSAFSTSTGLRLKLRPAQREHLVQDPKGDRVDAVLCLLQAAWAHQRAEAGDAMWGLPADFDPVEGWILGSQGAPLPTTTPSPATPTRAAKA